MPRFVAKLLAPFRRFWMDLKRGMEEFRDPPQGPTPRF
jgi:hypothetical protein